MPAVARCWQTDFAHANKPGMEIRQPDGPSPQWNVGTGIESCPGTQRTPSWCVRMVLSCQRARATRPE